MVASGALGFNGLGWPWERPLLWLRLLRPELFTVVLRTLTLEPRLYPVSNLSWIRPWTWLPFSYWSCVKFLSGGSAVNKVGLYNPGFQWWVKKVGPKINFKRYAIVASIQGTRDELVEMTVALDYFPLAGIEVNKSCPNSGHPLDDAQEVINTVKRLYRVSKHPIIVKVSVDQPYLLIALGVAGFAEAISINSVPWDTAFPGQASPMQHLGGGGGVSGPAAQALNWKAVRELAAQNALPVIGPSVMNYSDLVSVRQQGARAISFGSIHLKTPCRPTAIVKKDLSMVSAETGKDLYHVASDNCPEMV